MKLTASLPLKMDGTLEDDPFLLGRPIFSGAKLLLVLGRVRGTRVQIQALAPWVSWEVNPIPIQ